MNNKVRLIRKLIRTGQYPLHDPRRIKAVVDGLCRELCTPSARAATCEPPGALTNLTRKLSPQRAVELYREIAPLLVHQVLDALQRSEGVPFVNRVAEHLCSPAVQERLQASDHVRDAILDEIRATLGAFDAGPGLDRDRLREMLEASGAARNLMILENCITLAARNAG